MDAKKRNCIVVTQPIGTFYLSAMPALELLAQVDILPRSLDELGQLNVQRKMDPTRQKEISRYLLDPDATFPTPIIVSCYPYLAEVNEVGSEITLFPKIPDPVTQEGEEKDDVSGIGSDEMQTTLEGPSSKQHEVAKARKLEGKFGEVLDGQHRLRGIERFVKEHGAAAMADFAMPIVFMLELAPKDKAYVFSVINDNQRPVSSSLIFDLFDLAEDRSPQRTCHEIARLFNDDHDGPFRNCLKMLGKQRVNTELLTQGSFAKYVMTLISKHPDKDQIALKRGESLSEDPSCPLRKYFIANSDGLIVKILRNYFIAVRQEFRMEWDVSPEEYILRKTVGFAALIRAFAVIWPAIESSGNAMPENFAPYVKKFRDNIRQVNPNFQLTSAFVSSSGKGVIQLCNLFLSDQQVKPAAID